MTSETKLKNSWYDRGIRTTIFGIVVLIPLVFSPVFQSVFSMPKLMVLHSLCLLMLLLWGYKSLNEGKFTYYRSPLNIGLFAYAIVSIITTILSINFYTSFWGNYGRFVGLWTTLDLLFLTFCTATFFQGTGEKSQKRLVLLLAVSTITSMLVSLYSLAEYAGLLKDVFQWNQNPAERLFGTFGHANHLGAYLGMSLFLSVGLLKLCKRVWQRTVVAVSLLVQLSVLVLTGSRGAFISLILAVVIGLSLFIFRQHEKILNFIATRWKIFIALVIIILVSPFLLWPHIQQTALFQRTVQTFNVFENGNIPDRLSWWKSSLTMVQDKPFFGFGISTFRDIYNQYRRTDYKVPGPGHIQDLTTPETAHNEYLNIAATQGLLGLAVFISIIIIAVHTLLNAAAQKTANKLLIFSILGACLFYVFQSFVNFGVVSTMPIFFILLGLAGVHNNNSHQRAVPYKNFGKYIGSFIVVVIASLGFVAVWRMAMADVSLKEAYRAQAQGEQEKVLENCQKTLAYHSQEYLYFQNCADILAKLSKNIKNPGLYLELAEDFYKKAIALNNYHPSTFFNLGATQLYLSRYHQNPELLEQAAWSNFQMAIDKAVNNPLYSYQTAQLYLETSTKNSSERAKQALAITLHIQPDYKDAQKLFDGFEVTKALSD